MIRFQQRRKGDKNMKLRTDALTPLVLRVLLCVICCVNLLLFVEIKCQLDATKVFIADLIACSTCFGHHYAHHQELKSIIQWLLRVIFCAVVFFK